jgi:hypothetical protein
MTIMMGLSHLHFGVGSTWRAGHPPVGICPQGPWQAILATKHHSCKIVFWMFVLGAHGTWYPVSDSMAQLVLHAVQCCTKSNYTPHVMFYVSAASKPVGSLTATMPVLPLRSASRPGCFLRALLASGKASPSADSSVAGCR